MPLLWKQDQAHQPAHKPSQPPQQPPHGVAAPLHHPSTQRNLQEGQLFSPPQQPPRSCQPLWQTLLQGMPASVPQAGDCSWYLWGCPCQDPLPGTPEPPPLPDKPYSGWLQVSGSALHCCYKNDWQSCPAAGTCLSRGQTMQLTEPAHSPSVSAELGTRYLCEGKLHCHFCWPLADHSAFFNEWLVQGESIPASQLGNRGVSGPNCSLAQHGCGLQTWRAETDSVNEIAAWGPCCSLYPPAGKSSRRSLTPVTPFLSKRSLAREDIPAAPQVWCCELPRHRRSATASPQWCLTACELRPQLAGSSGHNPRPSLASPRDAGAAP